MARCRMLVALALATAAVAHAPADADDKPDRAKALASLLARTDSLAREVSKLRGLPLRRAIPNEVVDRATLRARLQHEAQDENTAVATAATGQALARWGLIPLATSYTDLVVDLLADQVAGYYDSDARKLTINETAGDDATWAELVLAHELEHGLQDQAFGLAKLDDVPDDEDDTALAHHALVEGDGIALMIELMFARHRMPAPWGDPTVAAALVRAIAEPAGDSLDRAPLAIRERMLFSYRDGFAFVAALRRRQSWRAVDAAFARPPRSTEQILHVDKYVADEKPIAITASVPPGLPGYHIVKSTVWGELGFQVFARAHGVAGGAAQEAAAGWGGDRVVVLARAGETRPERMIGIARLEWDSEIDAAEAEEAAVRAVDDAVIGAVVEHHSGVARWLALDGTFAWVERRGKSLAIVIGAPAYAADALARDTWTALALAKQKPL